MKFKFSFAVVISIVFHLSLFALAFYLPQVQKTSGPVYYVDLMNVPGDGGGGGGGSRGNGGNGNGGNGNIADRRENEPPYDTKAELIKSGSIKDLVVKKEKQESISSLRYPDKKNKEKSAKEKKEKPSLISIVKKNKNDNKLKNDSKFKIDNSKLIVTQRKGTAGDGLRTGISSGPQFGSGTGSGSGSGSGSGTGGGVGNGTGIGFGDGSGPGSGPGYFPYTYYIETLKGKISQSWYSSLVSPGLKGKFTATVYFKIQRNGSITDLGLENQSGNNSVDLSSLRAIKEAAPFPPLPSDFPGQYLGVHFEFAWER